MIKENRLVFALWIFLVLGPLLGTGCGQVNRNEVELLNVSYDPTRELWRDVNEKFIPQYEQKTGQKLVIRQSHASAGCTNGFNYATYAAPPFGTEGTSAPYAFHAGVLNAAFGDGSVRTISNSVSLSTFAALVTAAGGDIPGSDY
jgi:prepilin-type processing-associated H-X9-DG protein